MGMFLSKYSMLNALGYGGDTYVLQETKRVLDRYKLFGLILYDPTVHTSFHATFMRLFDKLLYLTGRDFLFFTVVSEENRGHSDHLFSAYYEDGLEQLLSPNNAYETKDESISAYSIAQGLNIDYDDLPVIILTDNLQFKHFRVVKTCPRHLQEQLTEIGYFSTNKIKGFDLDNDSDFIQMIKHIDICGGSYQVQAEETLAKTLSDFLSFVIQGDKTSQEKDIAKSRMNDVINHFLNNDSFRQNPASFEKMNLFLLGCLANISGADPSRGLSIDDRCEHESKVILKTYNKVFPLFDAPEISLDNHYGLHRTDAFAQIINIRDNELDYSPLVISLCKIFEIETNSSLLQWYREQLNINMPQYYKIRKEDRRENDEQYNIMPIVDNPKPINLNDGRGSKWLAPGLGQSELVARKFYSEKQIPSEIKEFDHLLNYWQPLATYRNKAAHTRYLNNADYVEVLDSFRHASNEFFGQMVNLKARLRGY